MQVHHRLPGVLALIDDDAVALLEPPLLVVFAHRPEHTPDERRALLVRFGEKGEVLLRHAQKMYFGLGLDVLEDEHLVVLVHFGGGDLPRNDLAENAVIHNRLTSVRILFGNLR